MNVMDLLRQVGQGALTFDDVKAQIQAGSFTGHQLTEGDWDAVWSRAEAGPDDDDVPAAVHAATYAKYISKAQGQQLIDIWTAKASASK